MFDLHRDASEIFDGLSGRDDYWDRLAAQIWLLDENKRRVAREHRREVQASAVLRKRRNANTNRRAQDLARRRANGEAPPAAPNLAPMQHGTVYAYRARGCRCQECRAAHAERARERGRAKGAVAHPYGPIPLVHGTHQAYRRGCRCDACKAANATVTRERNRALKAA